VALRHLMVNGIRLGANYATRVLPAREGENTYDEQLRIALQIKRDLMINR
jgi:hypothetical protein